MNYIMIFKRNLWQLGMAYMWKHLFYLKFSSLANSSKCNYAIPYGSDFPKTCTSAMIRQYDSSGEISLRKTCSAQKAISSKLVCYTKANKLELRKL